MRSNDPPLVMAGPDPAIQPIRSTSVGRLDWMATSRAAMMRRESVAPAWAFGAAE